MKYAIVSDIHANLAAWNAVLLDIRSNGVDCIICLGDMLGYGPRPREVLESLYTSVDHFLLGNHDAAICGKIDPQCFNEPAREIIRWTAAQLGESAKNFCHACHYVWPKTSAAPMPISINQPDFIMFSSRRTLLPAGVKYRNRSCSLGTLISPAFSSSAAARRLV